MKSKTIFDLLGDITFTKLAWEEQTEQAKKTMSPYMINRFLSMDRNTIELVNDVQQYTGLVGNEMTYKMYSDLLPKGKFFHKYIGNKTETFKHQSLLELIMSHFSVGSDEAMEIYNRTSKPDLIEFVERFGYTKKQFNL